MFSLPTRAVDAPLDLTDVINDKYIVRRGMSAQYLTLTISAVYISSKTLPYVRDR